MDNHFLRITGSVNIPTNLEIDTDYQFLGEISVYGADSRSNQDGTQSITYKAQFTEGIKLIKGDETVLAKSKLSQSQMLRKDCLRHGVDYDGFMTWLRHPEHLEELFRQFENL